MRLGAAVVGWTPREHPDPQRVAEFVSTNSVTGRLALEPLDPARHGSALYFSMMASGVDAYNALFDYMPAVPPLGEQAFIGFLNSVAHKRDPMFFAVLDCTATNKPARRPVGIFSLMRTDSTNGVTEIGFVLFSPLLKRTSIATELVYLLMEYLFGILNYRRFEWKCNDLNEPSMTSARRFGFTYEGTHRQALVVKGRNRDTAWFSVLDSEYVHVARPAFRQWLRADNFDGNGRQIMTLQAVRNAIKRGGSKL